MCNMSDNCQLTCRMIVVLFYISDECCEKRLAQLFGKVKMSGGMILLLMEILRRKKLCKGTEKCRRLYFIITVIVVVVNY